jgi:hypothetical protein
MVFVDGHVKFVLPSQWQDFAAALSVAFAPLKAIPFQREKKR